MTTGFAYWHPALYRFVMKRLYGAHFRAHYEAVAALVPSGASVVDVACGDCHLQTLLAPKGVAYTGLDTNERFVRHAAARGVTVIAADVRRDPIPRADYVIMQAGLYQFIPDHRAVVDSLVAAAGRAVVLSEPVQNVASRHGGFFATASDWATRVRGRRFPWRFSREDFTALLGEYGASVHEIDGGRDMVGVIPKPRQA